MAGPLSDLVLSKVHTSATCIRHAPQFKVVHLLHYSKAKLAGCPGVDRM